MMAQKIKSEFKQQLSAHVWWKTQSKDTPWTNLDLGTKAPQDKHVLPV